MAVLTIIGVFFCYGTVAHASEDGLTVVSAGNRVIVELSEDEMLEMSLEMSQNINGETVSEPMVSNTSYTPYRYSESFNFYYEGDWVARADAECVVWHYTDGKVHLYSRSIQLTKLVTIGGARIYGSIVNTDGSYSYTTGDTVYLYLDEGTWAYVIDFYVDATEGYFNCYQP